MGPCFGLFETWYVITWGSSVAGRVALWRERSKWRDQRYPFGLRSLLGHLPLWSASKSVPELPQRKWMLGPFVSGWQSGLYKWKSRWRHHLCWGWGWSPLLRRFRRTLALSTVNLWPIGNHGRHCFPGHFLQLCSETKNFPQVETASPRLDTKQNIPSTWLIAIYFFELSADCSFLYFSTKFELKSSFNFTKEPFLCPSACCIQKAWSSWNARNWTNYLQLPAKTKRK